MRRIVARFGRHRIGEVQGKDVRAWANEMRTEGLKESTVYANYRRSAQITGDAVHDGLVARSPCSRRTAPPQARQRVFVPTTEEVFALADALPKHLRAAVLLGAFAGLRTAEVVALRTEDIDFLRGVITPAFQHAGAPLKSIASSSPIPIPQELVRELSAAIRSPGQRYLVTDQAGRATTPWALRRAIATAKAAFPGVPGQLRFHDPRHYFASMLIGNGLDVKVVQTRLRHASVTTTLNTYGHLWPDADESARAAVGRVLAARADSLRTKTG